MCSIHPRAAALGKSPNQCEQQPIPSQKNTQHGKLNYAIQHSTQTHWQLLRSRARRPANQPNQPCGAHMKWLAQ
eukprot:1226671-Heterocapsa_arctica.AAC.1